MWGNPLVTCGISLYIGPITRRAFPCVDTTMQCRMFCLYLPDSRCCNISRAIVKHFTKYMTSENLFEMLIGQSRYVEFCSRHSVLMVSSVLLQWWISPAPHWWRHQMETFSALLALCAGNSPVTGEFPAQRPVTRSFDVFFDLRLNKRLSKQSWGYWFETPIMTSL